MSKFTVWDSDNIFLSSQTGTVVMNFYMHSQGQWVFISKLTHCSSSTFGLNSQAWTSGNVILNTHTGQIVMKF